MSTYERWRSQLPTETAFWDEFFAGIASHSERFSQWKDELRDKLDPEFSLQEDLRTLIHVPDAAPVRILDVGAGPLTSVGKRWDGHEVMLFAIDPLAEEYAKIRLKHGIVAPVRTEFGHGEDVAEQFSANLFDLAHARNALDHAHDPVKCIRAMVTVVKPGACVVLAHAIREADAQKHYGLHQWNFYPEAGCFWVEGGDEHVNVSEQLAAIADVQTEPQGTWVRVTIRKHAPPAP